MREGESQRGMEADKRWGETKGNTVEMQLDRVETKGDRNRW